MPARLIINADDFGLTPGINRAVLGLHRARILSSATLMANGPAFEDAVAAAMSSPSLGVGCHLVFVDGMPISPPATIPSLLASDGKSLRHSLSEFAFALYRGLIRADELAREARAQIETLQRAGIKVTHVDTHKHTHAFPLVARAVIEAATECGVPCYRYPFEPRWSRSLTRGSAPIARQLQVELLDRFEPSFQRIAGMHPELRTTDGTLGILATGTLSLALEKLCAEVAHRGPDQVFELCMHPGYVDAPLKSLRTRLTDSRQSEYDALMALAGNRGHPMQNLELCHYGHLHA